VHTDSVLHQDCAYPSVLVEGCQISEEPAPGQPHRLKPHKGYAQCSFAESKSHRSTAQLHSTAGSGPAEDCEHFSLREILYIALGNGHHAGKKLQGFLFLALSLTCCVTSGKSLHFCMPLLLPIFHLSCLFDCKLWEGDHLLRSVCSTSHRRALISVGTLRHSTKPTAIL